MERDRDEQSEAANASSMSTEERAKVRRLKLYHTLKERGDLGTYYYLYPDERPKGFDLALGRSRDDDEREH